MTFVMALMLRRYDNAKKIINNLPKSGNVTQNEPFQFVVQK